MISNAEAEIHACVSTWVLGNHVDNRKRFPVKKTLLRYKKYICISSFFEKIQFTASLINK